MRLGVESVIYLYLFVCVALLVFNILYIGRSKWVERQRERRIRRWEARLEASDITEKDASGLRRISQMTPARLSVQQIHPVWEAPHFGRNAAFPGNNSANSRIPPMSRKRKSRYF